MFCCSRGNTDLQIISYWGLHTDLNYRDTEAKRCVSGKPYGQAQHRSQIFPNFNFNFFNGLAVKKVKPIG